MWLIASAALATCGRMLVMNIGLTVSSASRTSSSHSPYSESPQRRWWSRKDSGAPVVKVWSHSDTLVSSTAIGFLSTP
jgi:hypothetical protein